MRLHDLKPVPGSRRKKKRVGRGPGSGWGKTAGRGTKGQKSRSGGGVPPWFEGGQMPLQRRVPKRGFTNIFRKEYAVVDVGDLNRLADLSVVGPDDLVAARLVKRKAKRIKLLGEGDLSKALTVKVHRASASAMEKVSKAGGKVELIGSEEK